MATWQDPLAWTVVLAALVYLARKTWQFWNESEGGCGSGGCRSCPSRSMEPLIQLPPAPAPPRN
jgi:hypothetical protein